jgi:uncharacterized protein (DUF1800 family)
MVYRQVSIGFSRGALLLLAVSSALGEARCTAQVAQQPAATVWNSLTSTSLQASGRILNQTSFGPTAYNIWHVEQEGVSAYVDEQLNEPAFLMPAVVAPSEYHSGDCNGWGCISEALWYQDVLFGQDQLRQRVAFALSKLFVVSTIEVDPRYLPAYLNILSNDAFGNWRTLMQDVATSSAMGLYLNMANSLAPTAGSHADENFARENMQLFNIGEVALNEDGSVKLDANGNTIPNYTPAVIQGFARAFTGYTLANGDCSAPKNLLYFSWGYANGAGCPMVPLARYHNTTEKTLLRGVILPAGQGAAADVTAALSNIFDDPSLPPFVSRRLIQNLVESNPSPAYISRIAAVFIDDGHGVRGNLKAVIRAILLDPEARAEDVGGTPNPDTGVMRDPVLVYTSILRTLGGHTKSAPALLLRLSANLRLMAQRCRRGPTCGAKRVQFLLTKLHGNEGTLYAPEFQLENSYSLSALMLNTQDLVDNHFKLWTANEFSIDLSATSPLGIIATTQGAPGLVSALDALLLHGTMTPNMASCLTTAITGEDPAKMVRNAVYLIVTSPQYRIII